MKLLVVVALLTACIAVPAALGRSTVECSVPGAWPHTKDAAWLARALTRAGLGAFGCTGTAFVVDLGGLGFTGQIYVSAGRGPPWSSKRAGAERLGAHTRIAGVMVHYGRVRGVWYANRRQVWVQTASDRPLLPPHRWRQIVRATLVTPG